MSQASALYALRAQAEHSITPAPAVKGAPIALLPTELFLEVMQYLTWSARVRASHVCRACEWDFSLYFCEPKQAA